MKKIEYKNKEYDVYFVPGNLTEDEWEVVQVDVCKLKNGEYNVSTILKKNDQKKLVYQESKNKVLQYPRNDKGINFFLIQENA
jgi:hypothetical protein